MSNATAVQETDTSRKLPKVSRMQLINLAIGAIGLQFAWAMQINLTGRVTEPLGATPFLLGLIWLAGPITGIIVQPIIGTLSDNIWTRFGRRRPFLLVGAILGALALVFMPYSSVLLMAAAWLWIIDICINVSMGPHRALIPDIMPPEQHSVANSLFSFGVGLGAIIAFGFPYMLDKVFKVQVSIQHQFLIAAIVLVAAMGWTCFSTPEKYKPEEKPDEDKESVFEPLKMFGISALISAVITSFVVMSGVLGEVSFEKSGFIINMLSCFILILSFPMLAMALKSFYTKEIGKLCAMQYLTWLGVMCLFIYFNNYVVHNIYLVPDLSSATEAVKASYEAKVLEATNFSGLGFALFNLCCFLVSIPLGLLCNKFGKKNVHAFSLFVMGVSFLGLAFIAKTTLAVGAFIFMAGIGWASILTIPYALMIDNAKGGTVGAALGKMNLFVAGPQILSSIAVGYLINKNPMQIPEGITNHWEYAFFVGGTTIILASIVSLCLKKDRVQAMEENGAIIDSEHDPLTA